MKELARRPGAFDGLGSYDRLGSLLLIVFGSLLALVLRYHMLPFESLDYKVNLSRWWAFIDSHGGFPALAHRFSGYNVPYLYVLAAVNTLFPGASGLTAIKYVSVSFDFVMAFFVYLLVRLEAPTGDQPALAYIVTLLAPTVLANGAIWGQCDSIYTAFLVAFLYYVITDRPGTAFVAYGIALSFKLQAVFMSPFLLWLIAAKRVKPAYLLVVPLVYFLLLVPAWALGRPLHSLLLIYINQNYAHTWLSMNIANLYVWIPNELYDYYLVGIIFTVMVVLFVAYMLADRGVHVDRHGAVLLATFSALLIPYILPKMHERFWFTAEVLFIVLAFCKPRFAWMPVALWSPASCKKNRRIHAFTA